MTMPNDDQPAAWMVEYWTGSAWRAWCVTSDPEERDEEVRIVERDGAEHRVVPLYRRADS